MEDNNENKSTIFKNKVGRPPKEIIRKRNILRISVIAVIMILIILIYFLITHNNVIKIKGNIAGSLKSNEVKNVKIIVAKEVLPSSDGISYVNNYKSYNDEFIINNPTNKKIWYNWFTYIDANNATLSNYRHGCSQTTSSVKATWGLGVSTSYPNRSGKVRVYESEADCIADQNSSKQSKYLVELTTKYKYSDPGLAISINSVYVGSSTNKLALTNNYYPVTKAGTVYVKYNLKNTTGKTYYRRVFNYDANDNYTGGSANCELKNYSSTTTAPNNLTINSNNKDKYSIIKVYSSKSDCSKDTYGKNSASVVASRTDHFIYQDSSTTTKKQTTTTTTNTTAKNTTTTKKQIQLECPKEINKNTRGECKTDQSGVIITVTGCTMASGYNNSYTTTSKDFIKGIKCTNTGTITVIASKSGYSDNTKTINVVDPNSSSSNISYNKTASIVSSYNITKASENGGYANQVSCSDVNGKKLWFYDTANYFDKDLGQNLRVIASGGFECGTILEFEEIPLDEKGYNGIKLYKKFRGIVLDRGVPKSHFDIATTDSKEAGVIGWKTNKVKYAVLRNGWNNYLINKSNIISSPATTTTTSTKSTTKTTTKSVTTTKNNIDYKFITSDVNKLVSDLSKNIGTQMYDYSSYATYAYGVYALTGEITKTDNVAAGALDYGTKTYDYSSYSSADTKKAIYKLIKEQIDKGIPVVLTTEEKGVENGNGTSSYKRQRVLVIGYNKDKGSDYTNWKYSDIYAIDPYYKDSNNKSVWQSKNVTLRSGSLDDLNIIGLNSDQFIATWESKNVTVKSLVKLSAPVVTEPEKPMETTTKTGENISSNEKIVNVVDSNINWHVIKDFYNNRNVEAVSKNIGSQWHCECMASSLSMGVYILTGKVSTSCSSSLAYGAYSKSPSSKTDLNKNIKSQIDKGIPVVMHVKSNTTHWVLIVGYNADKASDEWTLDYANGIGDYYIIDPYVEGHYGDKTVTLFAGPILKNKGASPSFKNNTQQRSVVKSYYSDYSYKSWTGVDAINKITLPNTICTNDEEC